MDDALRQRVGELLHERWGQLGVEGLLPEERDYVLLWVLHVEVNNGTLDQYLCNSSGDHAAEAVAALERLGLVETAAVLRRALDVLPGGWCADRTQRRSRVAATEGRWDVFQSLTDDYEAAIELEADMGEGLVERICTAYQREGILAPNAPPNTPS